MLCCEYTILLEDVPFMGFALFPISISHALDLGAAESYVETIREEVVGSKYRITMWGNASRSPFSWSDKRFVRLSFSVEQSYRRLR